MSGEDKKRMARQLYIAKTHDRAGLQKLLSVGEATLSRWLSDIDKAEREERRRRIQDLWLACYTAEDIGEIVGFDRKTVDREIDGLTDKSSEWKKSPKVSFSEEGFTPPIYNIWSFNKKTNEVGHFGNSEQRIVDNLLYLYTEPFDIVLDPFAGGGSTIDVCKKRMRRYFVSDRKP
jgi:DNA modification methylase